MASFDRKSLSISVPALCGALLWGLVETLALLRWRGARKNDHGA